MNWDYDLVGLNKMMDIIGTGKIIITVPAGPPIFYGDCLENGLPFLRRYDAQRMAIIRELVEGRGFKTTNEEFFYSRDLVEWGRVNELIVDPRNIQLQMTSPNCIWAFCIERN
jgi:hypothetical protein